MISQQELKFLDRTTSITMGHDWVSSADKLSTAVETKAIPSRLFLIGDTHTSAIAEQVARPLGKLGRTTETLTIAAGETSKSLASAEGLWNRLLDSGADRSHGILAIGGGVIGDLAGFVAATYMRGITWIGVPTTLVAMVDSSIGGKVGVNLPAGKNLVGAFWQPRQIWIDTIWLQSLPLRERLSGFAEIVKYAVLDEGPLWNMLESQAEALMQMDPDALTQVITRSVAIKSAIVQADEFERTGLRAQLNYGHTFGHALETVCGYGTLLHGEAVAIGMIWAAETARQMGMVDSEFCYRQEQLLARFGLPGRWPDVPAEAVLTAMQKDKKRADGQTRLILPRRIGQVESVPWPGNDLIRAVIQGSRGL